MKDSNFTLVLMKTQITSKSFNHERIIVNFFNNSQCCFCSFDYLEVVMLTYTPIKSPRTNIIIFWYSICIMYFLVWIVWIDNNWFKPKQRTNEWLSYIWEYIRLSRNHSTRFIRSCIKTYRWWTISSTMLQTNLKNVPIDEEKRMHQ